MTDDLLYPHGRLIVRILANKVIANWKKLNTLEPARRASANLMF
jgi:hypothetical protein